VPGVFLGSVGAAHDRDALDACGITHVLTVAGGFPPKFPDVYEYLVIDVADVSSENLDAHFEKCLKFIARALLDGGRVLVHCFAGRSRSSTVVAAYVMATEGLSLEETMALIKNARPCAMPNAGFAKQLAAFERRLSAARSEGRLLGRVQLDAANDGINRLAAVAVDAAAGLESDASSEDEEREEEEGKGKVSDPCEPEEDDETNAEGRGGRPRASSRRGWRDDRREGELRGVARRARRRCSSSAGSSTARHVPIGVPRLTTLYYRLRRKNARAWRHCAPLASCPKSISILANATRTVIARRASGATGSPGARGSRHGAVHAWLERGDEVPGRAGTPAPSSTRASSPELPRALRPRPRR
jgi:hypothetical protein